MLMPKRVKYRKAQRGRMAGKAQRGSTLAFGDYGLKALEPGWVTNRQIEAARVSLRPRGEGGGEKCVARAEREGGREDLHSYLPGQAGHQEARRDPDGQGQG